MTAKLSKELSKALKENGSHELKVLDPDSNRHYIICDVQLHEQAKKALDREAIQAGLQQMEQGKMQPLGNAFGAMKKKLGFG